MIALQIEHEVKAFAPQPQQAAENREFVFARENMHARQLRMVLQQGGEAVFDEKLKRQIGSRSFEGGDRCQRKHHVAECRQTDQQHTAAMRQLRCNPGGCLNGGGRGHEAHTVGSVAMGERAE